MNENCKTATTPHPATPTCPAVVSTKAEVRRRRVRTLHPASNCILSVHLWLKIQPAKGKSNMIKSHSTRRTHVLGPLAGTMQSGGKWMRSRFLRKARSEARAYPLWICKRQTTKSLRKKIEPTRPSQLHGPGIGPLVPFAPCWTT